ncbi:enoyl-CoA hydratase-related protein [Candidatus Frankia nodulisporulans]|uniref:enoyl-CoA hydratase-related protein n=1 Tax=Candidatus Frankia nodulisporulans TaxID=2060052 RepID=UPI001CDBDA65|nr:enoyl-CoA hydratase-related protein [Candidatus Frankia nodulisporulans]
MGETPPASQATASQRVALGELAPEDTVLRELDDDGVLLLTLNRPGRRNTWAYDMELRYVALLDEAMADPGVRVIVLTGAGEAFCAGMDMEVLRRATTDPSFVRPVRPSATIPRTVPKPIIAAVDGACAGVGFVQALMADLRFTTARSKWTTSFTRRGLIAEDTVTWLLPRLVGAGHAADLLFSGRVVRGDEAVRMGLANRLVEPDELLPAALDWARDVARNCSPWAVAQVKQQLARDDAADIEQSRLAANTVLDVARGKPDYREGVASFRERRPPRFEGLPADHPRIVLAAEPDAPPSH